MTCERLARASEVWRIRVELRTRGVVRVGQYTLVQWSSKRVCEIGDGVIRKVEVAVAQEDGESKRAIERKWDVGWKIAFRGFGADDKVR